MRAALAPLTRRYGITIAELDVDADPALESRFGERVPVLLLGSPEGGSELCHYVIDRARVVAALDRLSPPGQGDGAAQ
jgi:hypothetical protein